MSEPLTDPREIRKLLNEASYRGGRIDGKRYNDMSINVPASLVRHVMCSAEAQGFSGEDTMTVLAYHALLRYEEVLDKLIEQVTLTPAPRFISTDTEK